MEFAARLSSCEVYRSEVHETFMRKDMKHSNFSNYFIICLLSFFSIIEVILLFNIINVYAYFLFLKDKSNFVYVLHRIS